MKSLKPRPKAIPIELPEGTFIVKNKGPLFCEHCGKDLEIDEEGLRIGEEDEEDI